MQQLLKEHLVHFLLIGASLFLLMGSIAAFWLVERVLAFGKLIDCLIV